MKTSDLLLFAGLGIGGLYFLSNQKKDDSGSSGGGGGISLDLGGMGGIGGLGDIESVFAAFMDKAAGSISGLTEGGLNSIKDFTKSGQGAIEGFTGIAGGSILDFLTQGEAAISGFTGAGESAIKVITETGNGLLEKLTAIANNPAKRETPTPPGQPGPNSEAAIIAPVESAATQALRERGAAEFAGVGGAYLSSKLLPPVAEGIFKLFPKLRSSLLVKLAPNALRLLGPVGWVYTGADVIATGYELISGKNIAGSWLGWGELLGNTSFGHSIGFAESDPAKVAKNVEVPTPVGQPGPDPYVAIPDVPEKNEENQFFDWYQNMSNAKKQGRLEELIRAQTK